MRVGSSPRNHVFLSHFYIRKISHRYSIALTGVGNNVLSAESRLVRALAKDGTMYCVNVLPGDGKHSHIYVRSIVVMQFLFYPCVDDVDCSFDFVFFLTEWVRV